MFLAEIRGKLSSKQENSEDLLTSNVFSFFKYSQRNVYLTKLLKILNIECSEGELEDAQFNFWPTFDDRTEPDLVLIVGDHYVLIEAKLFADFGQKWEGGKSQIEREIEGGLNEANALKKSFHFIALTAHYHYPKDLFSSFSDEIKVHIRWLNWQAIAGLLLGLLEGHDGSLEGGLFAQDLYDLLDKKKLRGFLSFDRMDGQIEPSGNPIFFSAITASFRGAFLGFTPSLVDAKFVHKESRRLFFRRNFFQCLPNIINDPMYFKLGGLNE